MLHFYHFIFHSEISSVVIDKFSFNYFLLTMKTFVVFVSLVFHLKRNRLNTLLTNTITLVKYLRSFEMQHIEQQLYM